MDERSKEIMDYSLGNNLGNAEVSTRLYRSKVVKKSKWKTFPEKLKANNKINLLHKKCFKRLSRGGWTALSTSLGDIACDCFAV